MLRCFDATKRSSAQQANACHNTKRSTYPTNCGRNNKDNDDGWEHCEERSVDIWTAITIRRRRRRRRRRQTSARMCVYIDRRRDDDERRTTNDDRRHERKHKTPKPKTENSSATQRNATQVYSTAILSFILWLIKVGIVTNELLYIDER